MLVRIKGVVEDILMTEGRNKENRPWQKKTYVIRDNSYNKPEYNTKVYVNDFGRLIPESYDAEFTFRSNHIIGETVDLACYLETNDYGFTNVDYGKLYEDISKPKETNVIKPDAQPAPAEEATVEMQKEETGNLPF